jgi:tetratricopeptide (TPR) repeat protein
VIDQEPEVATNYYKRFRVHLRQKSFTAAIADLTSAITLNADYDQAYAQRGKLNLKIGNCAGAESDFTNLKRYVNE